MASHAINYTVQGASLQYVEIELDPDATVIAEAGAMMYMEDGIEFAARLGDGAGGVVGRLLGVARRLLTSESLFMTHFTNESKVRRRLAFAAPHAGQIVPVDLSQHADRIICQRDAFLCAARGTRISIAFQRRLGAGFFGGEGFILQQLDGEGIAFLHAGGTILERRLDDERLRVDTGCIVAFTGDIEYDIALAGGLRSMLFGGEGMFLATLSGRGTVWLQSLPFSRLADRVFEHAPQRTGTNKDAD